MSSRKSRLTRERIAAVALAIADQEGFAAVSMRRVAQELKVGTMSLYVVGVNRLVWRRLYALAQRKYRL